MKNKKDKTAVDLPELMTKKQVANYFESSTKTVERMMGAGLRSIKVRGKRYVMKSQLLDYINRSTRSA